MATTLKTDQRQAILLFYQKIADAKQTFNEHTDNGKRRDHLAWLSYYETKQAAEAELAVRIPRLCLVSDFWHHAHYRSLEEAIEKAWTKADEEKRMKQGELYGKLNKTGLGNSGGSRPRIRKPVQTKKTKGKGKKRKVNTVSRVV